MQEIRISPSGLATYENCPRLYQLERILKVTTDLTSCHLGFGAAAANAMEAFVRGTVRGQFVDPVPVFVEHWKTFVNSHRVQYRKGFNKEVLTEIGQHLMEAFPRSWERTGYKVLLDQFGEPMVERKLKVNLGKGVILVAKLDLMVVDPEGRVLLLDEKTPGSASTPDFTLMGDQLTAYQIATASHAPRLGIPKIDGLGYWELIKRTIPKKKGRGTGPIILDPCVVRPRTGGEVRQFVEKVHETADRIREGKFHKTPRMAWNSPCNGCPMLSLCSRQEKDGLCFPNADAEMAVDRLAA